MKKVENYYSKSITSSQTKSISFQIVPTDLKCDKNENGELNLRVKSKGQALKMHQKNDMILYKNKDKKN